MMLMTKIVACQLLLNAAATVATAQVVVGAAAGAAVAAAVTDGSWQVDTTATMHAD